MNKKFSTLVAAFALTAFAGNAATTAQTVDKLDKDALKGMYQLHDASNNMLVMHGDSLLLVDAAGLDTVGVSASLWCVQVSEPENQGQNPIFDFTNKKTGKFLAVSAAVVDTMNKDVISVPIVAGVNYQGWGWSKTYENKLESAKPMYTYIDKDSVVYLTTDGTDNNHVRLVKTGADKIGSTSAPINNAIAFTLKTAADVVLTAPEINAYLAGNKDVLKFDPDYKGTESLKNPFSTVAFRVDSVNGFAGTTTADDYGFMFVKAKADSSYLRVDTAWANASGEKFLKFDWMKKDANYAGTTKDSLLSTNNKLKNQYKFKFTYSPSVDSVFIQVQEATFKPETVKWWSDITAATDVKKYATNPDTLFVKLQDLIEGETRIVTIGKPAINTKISFGVTTCVAADDLSKSVADGVYYIKNNKGQYLTSPLDKNGKAMQWVTVEEESRDVAHMPAFQWIVLKDQTNPKFAETSPISIYNREFATAKNMANASQKAIQLYKAVGGTKYYANVASILGQPVDSLTFDLVPEASVKDSLLGYKNIEEKDLMIYKYQFNYFHSFNADKFVAVAKDSILGANNEKGAQFSLLNGDIQSFGYAVTKDIQKRIEGLKQLYRTEYRVVLGKDSLVNAKNDYYAVGAGNYNGGLAPYYQNVDSFYFKENNHYDGKHFYAIVRAQADTIGDVRVGVDDQVLSLLLKVQSLTDETRVSSFAIERDEEPLYRRFNNAALNESVKDGPDSLRFYESVRKEYLMDENNREGGLMDANVNYLGMWTADKATGLAFRIDTAWVTRGAGYIKPQYLVSVNRNDFAGKEGTPCQEDGPHIRPDGTVTTDPMECKHAHQGVPAFERGKYLVSFADSLALSKNDKPYADSKNGYTRVGFVEGIRMADTLWILPADFKALENEKIDFAALNAANKALVDAGKTGFKNILSGDQHKNYTWSFRYLSPELASNNQVTKEGEANRFLIESMSADNTDSKNWIAPEKAQWLKIQNGCVVLTRPTATFNDAALGVDGALRFNVENKENDELATDNEAIATSEVAVIAQEGAVRIANAEGKKVVITNILGQVVANTVITSSDAVIAAPQGVVVVAVEGEEAVKAIVK
ncbi:DUF6383 domain-containing protein [uncultured Parabacteroides sp.]|jgi:hypothetical protein|uniref:DUF6383 domain-containing protein n=1 Tax=uncultured Parabacteroides sp. TaxID=512312 RepID=UPI0025FE4F8D|nr:DUF6383 domain-containing protein [uncultured Parabacteroides sp.]